MKKMVVVASLLMFGFSYAAEKGFILITSLYNETNVERLNEYVTCMEKNIQHPLINEIHVLYDTSKDDANNYLLNVLKSMEIEISYITGRPSFSCCFDLANTSYPKRTAIVSNADIYFNETLALLENYDFENKLIVLTRWNVNSDNTITIFKQNTDFNSGSSHDAWIFKTPLLKFNSQKIFLGEMYCDGRIAYEATKGGLVVCNPCLSIQACHLHLSDIRNYIVLPLTKDQPIVSVSWSYLT